MNTWTRLGQVYKASLDWPTTLSLRLIRSVGYPVGLGAAGPFHAKGSSGSREVLGRLGSSRSSVSEGQTRIGGWATRAIGVGRMRDHSSARVVVSTLNPTLDLAMMLNKAVFESVGCVAHWRRRNSLVLMCIAEAGLVIGSLALMLTLLLAVMGIRAMLRTVKCVVERFRGSGLVWGGALVARLITRPFRVSRRHNWSRLVDGVLQNVAWAGEDCRETVFRDLDPDRGSGGRGR